MGIIILIFVLLILGFFTYAFAYWYIRVNNFEIELRNDGLAKQKICQTYFDKMRKIILTQAQIKDDYLNSFNDIFVDIMEGRYGDKNSKKGLFNMITESNPNFSDKLFKKTMVTIDAQRNSFQYHQEQLIEIDKKHKIFRSVFPNVLVIGRSSDIGINLISSSDAISAQSLGQENDVDIPLNTRRTPK